MWEVMMRDGREECRLGRGPCVLRLAGRAFQRVGVIEGAGWKQSDRSGVGAS